MRLQSWRVLARLLFGCNSENPEFRQLISQQRRLFLDVAAGILARASSGAAEVLDELAHNEDEAGHVRRSASRDILDHAMRLRESGELEERMQAIEEQMRKLDG